MATWCRDRGCWVVRHPRRSADIVGTGPTKAEAEAQAEAYLREERERLL